MNESGEGSPVGEQGQPPIPEWLSKLRTAAAELPTDEPNDQEDRKQSALSALEVIGGEWRNLDAALADYAPEVLASFLQEQMPRDPNDPNKTPKYKVTITSVEPKSSPEH